MELRKELAAQKKSEYKRLTAELEKVEYRFYELEAETFKERELRLLAKLIFTGAMLVQSDSHEFLKRGRYAMNKTTFKSLEKKLEKKNAELIEVRDFRKKLDDKEKEICAEIDKLQSQKIEILFEEIKRKVRNDNIDVSVAAILPVLEALRNHQQTPEISTPKENDSVPVTTTEKLDENNTHELTRQLGSIS